MKNQKTFWATLFIAVLMSNFSWACIDYSTTAFPIVSYDEDIEELEIRITNLQLFGGNPNEFCSCAISNFLLTDNEILYVAFVDSGTFNPVPGFEPYVASISASSAWDEVLQTGDWNGFVSEVNGNGLTPGNPVELVIRAYLAFQQGNPFFIDSLAQNSVIGTDEWDVMEDNLADSHQNLFVGFSYWETQIVDEDYFQMLDESIISSLDELNIDFLVYPNPSQDIIQLNVQHIWIDRMRIYDSGGKLVHEKSGLINSNNRIDISFLRKGLYFLRLDIEDQFSVKEFIVR
ncbi:MAG: T9SS type A sorting domain-containing protein [Bacteroidota bacterium]